VHSTDSRASAIERSTHAKANADAMNWPDIAAAAFLLLATAAIVVWENSRLSVLWDLSYILESSFRISLGDVPYRDFVLPYAPLTFLTQAVLIKLTGRVLFHHIIYCAVVGGLSTVLTWRILLNIFRGTMIVARPAAFLLSVPLIALGIYSVFPHPFYDPDCTFAVLLCVWLFQKLELKGFRPLLSFFTGVCVVVPWFVKQNTGLAFLASVALGLTLLIVQNLRNGDLLRGYAWMLAGVAAGVAGAALLIHRLAGINNYVYWTVQFAASRRLPPFHDMLDIYWSPLPLYWVAIFVAGIAMFKWNRQAKPSLTYLSGALMALPFAWPAIYILKDSDSSERAERLLALWPFLLVVSFAVAVARFRKRTSIRSMLPFILIGTVQGAFLSQQLWGSTYAIWPLFIILFADTIEGLVAFFPIKSGRQITIYASFIAISMTIAGGFYLQSHERLNYADLDEGELAHSTLPALAGLSARGPWIPQFAELVRFTEREVPREDGLLMIPGEDLFYYATGRHPRFPVLMFDHTINPYSPEQILSMTRTHKIRWLVVKRELQLNDDPVENKKQLLDLLRQDFEQVESLDNYDIYRLKSVTLFRPHTATSNAD
jgi:hypothetical protein